MSSLPEVKVCTKCGVEKAAEEFGKDIGRKDGRFPWCKLCRARNPAVALERARNLALGLRWCSPCRRWLSPERFGKNRSIKDGIHRNCRECAVRITTDYRKRNIDRRREYERGRDKEVRARQWQSWYARNREALLERLAEKHRQPAARAKMALANARRRTRTEAVVNDLTAAQWQRIVDGQGRVCLICCRPFSDSLPATRDHRVPVSKGGGLTEANTIALCKSCNSAKRDRDFDETAGWLVRARERHATSAPNT